MRPYRRSSARRGVTLLEMLVVVALVVLMMLILASIFQAATGAMTSMRTYQELDDNLRLLDLTLRSDLNGTTAVMTPPNNPLNKTGYFEYGENAPADLQGEDTDDYLAFTAKAPEGRVFTGRFWVSNNIGSPGLAAGAPGQNFAVQPVTITSKYAEIIYFLRNGNLYRRVLLIVPEKRGAMPVSGVAAAGVFVPGLFQPNMFNNGVVSASGGGVVPVGWPAVCDVSARPNDGPDSVGSPLAFTPVPNDLGDLTNRENRFARQRLARDFFNVITQAQGRDGLIDDVNGDLIPDYYPTLTWTQVTASSGGSTTTAGGTPTLINVQGGIPTLSVGGSTVITNDLYAFPFIFPGMYSKPETASLDSTGSTIGWLHAIDPTAKAGIVTTGGVTMPANQSPIELGDSLPAPSAGQTWWGFPTFRETASVNWKDPINFPGISGSTNTLGAQVHGLKSFDPTKVPSTATPPFHANFLPPLGSLPPLGTPGAPATPYGSDGAGNVSTLPFVTVTTGVTVSATTTAEQLSFVWDDDLIMTGVRSFDVKALDINAKFYNRANATTTKVYSSGYYDLGYAASDYVGIFGDASLATGTPTAYMQNLISLVGSSPPAANDGSVQYNVPVGFGHEGRMPPNSTDFRIDSHRPFLKDSNGNFTFANNIGDDSTGLNRIRRVWDSWSTDYMYAPDVSGIVDPTTGNPRGSTLAPSGFDRPVYPSYPPPYPQALRGIQIQIRVVDPKNEKVKVLTIRHDFSDKL